MSDAHVRELADSLAGLRQLVVGDDCMQDPQQLGQAIRAKHPQRLPQLRLFDMRGWSRYP